MFIQARDIGKASEEEKVMRNCIIQESTFSTEKVILQSIPDIFLVNIIHYNCGLIFLQARIQEEILKKKYKKLCCIMSVQ